jgi:hypothetical protein
MHSLRRCLLAGVMLASIGSASLAQTANGSDVTGPPSFSLAGGAFAPLPSSHRSDGASVGSSGVLDRVRRIGTEFATGAAQRSPATGQVIPAEAVQAVGELITTGSPAAEARIARALQADGASPESVAFLTQALGELSRASPASAPLALIAASQHFDALVRGAPVSFMRSPPAQFLAIHAALIPMVKALRR